MPYIEQYVSAGSTTSADWFLISRNNVYFKLSKTDLYAELTSLLGATTLTLADIGGVDINTLPPVTGQRLRYDGTNFVNSSYPITNLSSSSTLTLAQEYITVDTSGGSITLTLPTAATTTGKEYNIYKLNAANTLTIDGSGAGTINGATTIATTTQWACIRLISNGTYWVASTL